MLPSLEVVRGGGPSLEVKVCFEPYKAKLVSYGQSGARPCTYRAWLTNTSSLVFSVGSIVVNGKSNLGFSASGWGAA